MAGLNAYYGITVTLDGTAQNLLALLVAIDSSLSAIVQNVAMMSLQADQSNGANSVYVGDANVSSSRKAYELLVHDQTVYRKEAYNVPLGAIYVRGSAAGTKLNVEVLP